MANNNNPTFVVTGRSRLSFVHLFAAYANPNGGEPKFSTTILIPKSDVATKQRIDAAIYAAIQEGISGCYKGVQPPLLSTPVHDGDGVRPSDGMPFGEECRGHWVMTASSKTQPQIVDLSLNPILSQSEVYSGIYARVSIRFFPYENSGKKGVGCGLNNVQKLEDGEPLGGRTTALDDFGAAQGQPQPQYAPQQPQYAPQQPQYSPQVQPQYPQQPVPQPQYAPQQPAQPQYAPQQPQYPQQPTQPQIDPITGQPIGGVMGLGQ